MSKIVFRIWFSSKLKLLSKEKKKLLILLEKKYNNISDYLHFSHLRAKQEKLAKSDFKYYIKKVQSYIKQNPTRFEKCINNQKSNNA